MSIFRKSGPPLAAIHTDPATGKVTKLTSSVGYQCMQGAASLRGAAEVVVRMNCLVPPEQVREYLSHVTVIEVI